MATEALRLGMVRLTDAAPVVHALDAGLFEAEGLDVALSVEPSWANIADKLAWGVLDAAVLPGPLAIAMALGLRGRATALSVVSGISRDGNAVTLSSRLEVAELGEMRPRLAVVHAFSTHDLLLRLWLEQVGLDPTEFTPFDVLPPAEMVAALAQGRIDGFCAGAPWGAVAAEAGDGRTVAVSSAIAPGHPEKCLAVRGAWGAAHDGSRLRRAMRLACAFCDAAHHGDDLAAMLSEPDRVGVPARLIRQSLPGGRGESVDRARFDATLTRRDVDWLIGQLGRWRALPTNTAQVMSQLYASHLPATEAASRN